MTRKITTAIYEAVDEGILTWDAVARECLAYMSEDDVADMNRVAEFVRDPEDESEDDE